MKRQPKRIQRKRTKGWRLPKGAICVSRPSRFGNPFNWHRFGRRKAKSLFRRLVTHRMFCPEMERYGGFAAVIALCSTRTWILAHLHELRDHDLCCWCRLDAACHADVLLELANKEMP